MLFMVWDVAIKTSFVPKIHYYLCHADARPGTYKPNMYK